VLNIAAPWLSLERNWRSKISGGCVKQYEYCLVFLDRLELREGGPALQKLNDLGSAGWHVVTIRDDPQHNRDLAFFMEREKT